MSDGDLALGLLQRMLVADPAESWVEMTGVDAEGLIGLHVDVTVRISGAEAEMLSRLA